MFWLASGELRASCPRATPSEPLSASFRVMSSVPFIVPLRSR